MSAPPVKASPTKGLFLEALTRDLDLEDAVHDLVDNSIDAAKRIRGRGALEGLYITDILALIWGQKWSQIPQLFSLQLNRDLFRVHL